MRLTEQAFVVEFGKLANHLTERLSGSVDGKPKVFRDSAVEKLSELVVLPLKRQDRQYHISPVESSDCPLLRFNTPV